MIQSTNPITSGGSSPDEEVPEGEDQDNHNFTPSEAEEIESGRQWYLENFRRDQAANLTT